MSRRCALPIDKRRKPPTLRHTKRLYLENLLSAYEKTKSRCEIESRETDVRDARRENPDNLQSFKCTRCRDNLQIFLRENRDDLRIFFYERRKCDSEMESTETDVRDAVEGKIGTSFSANLRVSAHAQFLLPPYEHFSMGPYILYDLLSTSFDNIPYIDYPIHFCTAQYILLWTRTFFTGAGNGGRVIFLAIPGRTPLQNFSSLHTHTHTHTHTHHTHSPIHTGVCACMGYISRSHGEERRGQSVSPRFVLVACRPFEHHQALPFNSRGASSMRLARRRLPESAVER